jgi:hypothetical protein
MPDQRGNHHRIAQKFGVAAEDWMKHREVARDPAPSAPKVFADVIAVNLN